MKVKTLFSTLALLAFLGGCSSTPSNQSEAQVARATYTRNAEDNLEAMKHKADRLKGRQQADLKAMIADTRAELNRMEVASDSLWEGYKSGIDQRLYQMSTRFNTAE